MKRLGGGCEGEVFQVSDSLVKKVWREGKKLDDVKSKYSKLKEKMESVSEPDVALVFPKKYAVSKDGRVVTYSKYIPKKPLDFSPAYIRQRWRSIERKFEIAGIYDLHFGNVIYYKKKWYIIDAWV